MKKVCAANRILLCLLSAILVLTVLSAAAFADGEQVTVRVTVTPGSKTFHYGDDVTFDFTLINNSDGNIGSVEFNIDFDSATGDLFSSVDRTYIIQSGLSSFSCADQKTGKFDFSSGDVDYGQAGNEIKLLTVKAKIKTGDNSVPVGSRSITIKDLKVYDPGEKGSAKLKDSVAPAPTTITLEHRDGVDGGDGDHDYSGAESWEGGIVANCTTSSTKYTACATPGCTSKKTEKIDYGGKHDWNEIVWEWGDGNYNSETPPKTATAKRSCKRVGCVYHDPSAENATTVEVKAVKVDPATCTRDGSVNWEATATFAAEPTTATTAKPDPGTLEKLGHDWDTPNAEWDWSQAKASFVASNDESNIPDKTLVSVKVTCKNDKDGIDDAEHRIKVDSVVLGTLNKAGCDGTGDVTFKATAKLPSGKDDSTTSIENTSEQFEIAQLPHTWKSEEIQWQGDWTPSADTTPTATLTCTGVNRKAPNAGQEHVVNGNVSVKVTESTAMCEKVGNTTYTATAEFNAPVSNNTKDYKTENAALGHLYAEPEFNWDSASVGDDYKMTGTVTATRKCVREAQYHDGELTDKATGVVIANDGESNEKKEPNCTTPVDLTYTATATFDTSKGKWEKEPQEGTRTGVSGSYHFDALGHDWQKQSETTGFKWTPEAPGPINNARTKPQATIDVICKRKDCDKGYNETQTLKAEVNAEGQVTQPTCEKTGSVTFSAKAQTPDGKESYTDSQKYTIKALEHDWNDPVFTWDTSKPGAYTVTVKRTCKNSASCDFPNGEATQADTGKLEVTNVVDTQPTYLAEGKRTWTATVTFDTKSDKTAQSDEFTDTVPETIDKLKPPATTADVGDSVADGDAAEKALKDSMDELMKQALSTDGAARPAGMDQADYEALRAAAGKTGNTLSVETDLTVQDSDLSPVDGQTYTPASGRELDKYYDIDVTLKVTSSDGATPQIVAPIHETANFIRFSVAHSADHAGPIWYVARYHDGAWQELPTTLVGDALQFDSNLFSPYAVVSSNNIADADVDYIPDQTYTGSAITPKVFVYINGDREQALKEGVDYELEWHNNVNVGEAYVVVKALKDNEKGLTGELTVYFQIVPAPSTGGGSGSGKPVSPDTGDETNVGLYTGLTVLGLTALAAVTVLPRRRKNK